MSLGHHYYPGSKDHHLVNLTPAAEMLHRGPIEDTHKGESNYCVLVVGLEKKIGPT